MHTLIKLQVFDMKLRHMRGDIAAIEASNNMLELQVGETLSKYSCTLPLYFDLHESATTHSTRMSGWKGSE
jgi:hypothetical protein